MRQANRYNVDSSVYVHVERGAGARFKVRGKGWRWKNGFAGDR